MAMKTHRMLLASIFLLSLPIVARGQWVSTTSGFLPEYNGASSLLAEGSDLWATTRSGNWHSSDLGQTWASESQGLTPDRGTYHGYALASLGSILLMSDRN